MAAGPVSRLGSFEPGDKTGLRLSPHLTPNTHDKLTTKRRKQRDTHFGGEHMRFAETRERERAIAGAHRAPPYELHPPHSAATTRRPLLLRLHCQGERMSRPVGADPARRPRPATAGGARPNGNANNGRNAALTISSLSVQPIPGPAWPARWKSAEVPAGEGLVGKRLQQEVTRPTRPSSAAARPSSAAARTGRTSNGFAEVAEAGRMSLGFAGVVNKGIMSGWMANAPAPADAPAGSPPGNAIARGQELQDAARQRGQQLFARIAQQQAAAPATSATTPTRPALVRPQSAAAVPNGARQAVAAANAAQLTQQQQQRSSAATADTPPVPRPQQPQLPPQSPLAKQQQPPPHVSATPPPPQSRPSQTPPPPPPAARSPAVTPSTAAPSHHTASAAAVPTHACSTAAPASGVTATSKAAALSFVAPMPPPAAAAAAAAAALKPGLVRPHSAAANPMSRQRAGLGGSTGYVRPVAPPLFEMLGTAPDLLEVGGNETAEEAPQPPLPTGAAAGAVAGARAETTAERAATIGTGTFLTAPPDKVVQTADDETAPTVGVASTTEAEAAAAPR